MILIFNNGNGPIFPTGLRTGTRVSISTAAEVVMPYPQASAESVVGNPSNSSFFEIPKTFGLLWLILAFKAMYDVLFASNTSSVAIFFFAF